MLSTTWLLCGGGLANTLLARRLRDLNRDFQLVERGPALFNGQPKTWSCQLSDVDPADRPLLAPLVTARWDGYEVRFPSFRRTIMSPYLSLRSEDLPPRLNLPADRLRFNTDESLEAKADYTVRATGFPVRPTTAGWQKFVGFDVEFEKPHGLSLPVLMDADVAQIGGYRFFYLLPFGPRQMLIEETRYADEPELDRAEFARGIAAYLAERFPNNTWQKRREESGSLPIPWEPTEEAGRFGVAGGFFHPATGYSLPAALRTSRRLIEECDRGRSVDEALARIGREEFAGRRFYFGLNRMMFLACPPTERRGIFARFYGFDEGFIARFYAGRSTALDKVRMLSGRPPVKINHAVRAFMSAEPAWK